MNLIDAVRSGRPIKRRSWDDGLKGWLNLGGHRVLLEKCEILAEDWEIDEPKVSITRAQLEVASKIIHRRVHNQDHDPWWINPLAKELGL